MTVQGTDGLRAGYACVEITPPLGSELCDKSIFAAPRRAERVRDPLFARALHLEVGERSVTLVCVDILLITGAMHVAVARELGVDRAELLLSATHTHSGPGGYWNGGPRVARVLGTYRESVFDDLVRKIAEAARLARADARPASMRAGRSTVIGASANRRKKHGPVDSELSLVRVEPEGALPIDVVSYGAHPVIGTILEPLAISADFPGVVCAALAKQGIRPLFFQGAVGGLSPLFPEFPMSLDDHLALVGDLLLAGHARACTELAPVSIGPLERRLIASPVTRIGCHIVPDRMRLAPLLEGALTPVRRWVTALGQDGMSGEPEATLHLVRLGDLALLGTPCDLGVSVGLALKAALREAGTRIAMVGSQCDGHLSYVHLGSDYAEVPERGFREMALYENALSFGGWDLGDRFVRVTREALRA